MYTQPLTNHVSAWIIILTKPSNGTYAPPGDAGVLSGLGPSLQIHHLWTKNHGDVTKTQHCGVWEASYCILFLEQGSLCVGAELSPCLCNHNLIWPDRSTTVNPAVLHQDNHNLSICGTPGCLVMSLVQTLCLSCWCCSKIFCIVLCLVTLRPEFISVFLSLT